MPPDQARLQTIVEEHGLAHLNAWCRAAGPTFVHAKAASVIDHVLMRASQTDNRAKQAKPVDVALAAWRLGGKRLPVQASLPVVSFHSLNHPARQNPREHGITGRWCNFANARTTVEWRPSVT